MVGLWQRINNEPAVVMAIVQSGLALGLAFGVDLTEEQLGGLLAFTALVLGFATRSVVTPVLDKPQPKSEEEPPPDHAWEGN